MKEGAYVLAAAIVSIARKRNSLTSRSCKVRCARSDLPRHLRPTMNWR